MVLLTRDQAELVDAVVAFHLDAGVDFVLAVDHSSSDGTAELLERYERDGWLRLFRRGGSAIGLLREELARLAWAKHEADWVLHPDGDEFWWPRGGSWKDVLGAVPPRYGVVRGAWRHFAPRPEPGGHFAERLVVRMPVEGSRSCEAEPFHPGIKVAHRARPGVALRKAAHDADVPGLQPLRGLYPFEILHFPLRSREQGRAKYLNLTSGLDEAGLHVPPHVRRAKAEIDAGRWNALYDALVVDDAALESGLATGTLALDTRLRDRLRSLAGVSELGPDAVFAVEREGRPAAAFPVESAAERLRFVDEVQVLLERESDVRFVARVEALDRRVGELEGLSVPALGTRAANRAARVLGRRVRRRRGTGGRS